MSITGDKNVGSVTVTFMNISGRICADEWDDADAAVVCRQLGYSQGLHTDTYVPINRPFEREIVIIILIFYHMKWHLEVK